LIADEHHHDDRRWCDSRRWSDGEYARAAPPMHMTAHIRVLALVILATVPLFAGPDIPLSPDPSIRCEACDEWNGRREPFQIFGNTYYVGVSGLSSVLITSSHGHILVDGGLPQSAALIDAHIRALGFRTSDIRLIVASHEHFDHVGGIAALQRASRARVAVSGPAARALRGGEPLPEDPQFGFGHESITFPRVRHVREVRDGETLRVGDLNITAHRTPGHTPGSTSWVWRSCEQQMCADIVYADSLTPVSAPGFRFTSGGTTLTPLIGAFYASIRTIERLPCDIVITPHPGFTGMNRKLADRTADPSHNSFINANGCREYAATMRRLLEQRIAEETRR